MFRITVKDDLGKEWTEDYPNLSFRGNGWDVENQYEAEVVGKSFIDKFNKTLRPGESPREFVKAEFLGEDNENPNPI